MGLADILQAMYDSLGSFFATIILIALGGFTIFVLYKIIKAIISWIRSLIARK
ncbi:hypothetical protein KAR52_01855 [Candidatus Pacearchaeota archaeon]|nr:hypothetical protein [Candidatus Pacearchaeota archaeon]